MKTALQERINPLPPELRREVEDFVEFLSERRLARPGAAPAFKWAGALADIPGHPGAVELQHRIAAWRAGGA